MIRINHIQHQFGDHSVIDDFNLNIEKGKIVTFLGKSGCGKSTMLNIIGGFLTPSSGTVKIEDQLKQNPSPDCLMIFHHHNLLPWKNINYNIRLGLNREMCYAEINNYLTYVDLDHKGKTFPEQLSRGMKHRVALCRAQVHQPKVILMDEPLGAPDAFPSYKLQDQL